MKNIEDQNTTILMDVRDALVTLHHTISNLLIFEEIKMKHAESEISQLIESGKNLENFLNHIEEHSSDDELTPEELMELEKNYKESRA